MKIGIVSQARMGSQRLHGKVMRPIENTPLLQYHLERLSSPKYPVILATSNNPEDDIIENFCKTHSIACVRGSDSDVLSRYLKAAEEHSLDTIVRVTADCPLIDLNIIRRGIREHVANIGPYLYTSNCIERSYPRGFDFEIFQTNYLKEIGSTPLLSERHREHVTLAINENLLKKTKFLKIQSKEKHQQFRVTVDYEEDFLLIEALIKKFQAQKLSCSEIVSVLTKHPELSRLNAEREQKKV